jgi:hypothetical protein
VYCRSDRLEIDRQAPEDPLAGGRIQWKTLLRCEKNWNAIARALRANVDVALTLYRNGSWAA